MCCSPTHPKLSWILLHIYWSLYVLCTFPFALKGAKVTPVYFVIGYSALFLWQKSGGELECLSKESFLRSSVPLDLMASVTAGSLQSYGKKKFLLSWFGFWPEVAPHKMFKEVLEYLSKQRLRTVFSAAPSCVCSMTQGVSWGQGVLPFNFIRGKAVRQDPDSSVYCSISVFYLLFFSQKFPDLLFHSKQMHLEYFILPSWV